MILLRIFVLVALKQFFVRKKVRFYFETPHTNIRNSIPPRTFFLVDHILLRKIGLVLGSYHIYSTNTPWSLLCNDLKMM